MQYTLTPAHAHARMQKYLRLADHGPRCRADTLWAVLCYAASRILSLAAACAALRDAPSDTAAHDALLATLPNYAELQRRLNRALQGDLPHALRRRRQPLAADLVLIPYHGKPLHSPEEVYRSRAKSGTSQINEDGTYSIANVPAGSAKIAVDNLSSEPGRKLPPNVKHRPPKSEPTEAPVKIPAKYKKPETSGLTCEVTGGRQTHNIELK